MIHVIGHDYISMVFDGYTQNTKATGSGIVYYMIFLKKKLLTYFGIYLYAVKPMVTFRLSLNN